MSKILKLDPAYDIWLSMTWSSNDHGICGHVYEIFDYFQILKKHFKVGIFFAETIDIEMALKNKYDFTDKEIQEYKDNTVFGSKPSLLQGTNILFVDGGVVNAAAITLLFNNIFYFACGNKEVKDNNKKNVYILQDNRVYDPVNLNGIDYKKRILFDRLKPIAKSNTAVLLYATKNCRNIDNYEQFFYYSDNIIAITNVENRPADIEGITFLVPPLEDIFEKFDTYVYTPVTRKWDCSPRFIAECKYYNKEVIYHNIDYWDIDHGLRVRKWDIDNDFESLFLKSDDSIITILKDVIC